MTTANLSEHANTNAESDEKDFASIYHLHFPPIFRFLRSRKHDPATAEDLAHTTFVRFFEYSRKKTVSDVRSFLFRTALNLTTDLYRKNNLYDEIFSHDASIPSMPERCHDQESTLKASALSVKDAIAKMPDRRREVFLLRVFYNFSNAEVAERVGIKEGAVRVQFSRAIADCRAAMNSESKSSTKSVSLELPGHAPTAISNEIED